jgi:hypothetical protein
MPPDAHAKGQSVSQNDMLLWWDFFGLKKQNLIYLETL